MSTITEIYNDYTPGYHVEPYINDDGEEEPYTSGTIAGTGNIVSRVTGDLATRVQVRADRLGEVTIEEAHWDDGYCVTCSYEQVEFRVYVDGAQVYSNADYYNEIGNAEGLAAFGEFNAWLNEEKN